MTVQGAESRLRLSSARRRINSFLEQIDVLKEASFPHEDGRLALLTIEDRFVELRDMLDLPKSASTQLADQACQDILYAVSDYTEILGFILRSTNVRNPFELYFVLKGFIERAFGQKAKLLISSEWAFVPFTYPMSLELLPEFVLIGSPAPESSDPLVIPLAGHEIGHSAWIVFQCEAYYSTYVIDAVTAALDAHSNARDDLFDQHKLGSLALNLVRDRCAKSVMMQLEEVYCDLFGLFMFGESYLYAFDYLLGPGGIDRSMGYPSDARRMELLSEAASELDIPVDPVLTSHWNAAKFLPAERSMAVIVDAAVDTLVAKVQADIFLRLRRQELAPPNHDVIRQVASAFERGEPYDGQAELGEIISAGWKYLQAHGGLARDNERIQYKMLGDLVLKTIEVAEYMERTTEGA